VSSSERSPLGIPSDRKGRLDAQVVLAELVDDAVGEDRRPHRAAADREIAEPPVEPLLLDDAVRHRVDLPDAATPGLAGPDRSVGGHEIA
jgi:hypothetical protein